MLISEILEKTQQMSAAENMANRLADKVRNLWLTNRAEGRNRWEKPFLRIPME